MKAIGRLFLFMVLGSSWCCGIDVEPTSQDYGVIDSDHSGGIRLQARPDFVWIYITASGERVVGGGGGLSSVHPQPDGIGGPVELPQPFPFYGEEITRIVPCSYGYLSTDLGEDGSDATPLCPPAGPADGGGARIYGFHAPLRVLDGVYFEYFELSPHPYKACGVSIFSWEDVRSEVTGDRLSFQILLFDTGDILMQYAAGNSGMVPDATIGIQDSGAKEGLAFHCGGALNPLPAGSAVLFRAPEVVISSGDDLATAIAAVRPGGKVRFTNDADPGTDDLIEVPATILINKPVCIDANFGTSNTEDYQRRLIDGRGEVRAFDVAPSGACCWSAEGSREDSTPITVARSTCADR